MELTKSPKTVIPNMGSCIHDVRDSSSHGSKTWYLISHPGVTVFIDQLDAAIRKISVTSSGCE